MQFDDIHEARVQFLNEQERKEDGDYVLYWMQQAQRAEWNHAFEYAVRAAKELDTGVVVVFGLMDDYPEANLRHYTFMLQGLAEPDTARCVAISTNAALREMVAPGILAVVSPVIVGFFIGPAALGGMLLGALIVGIVTALLMSNAGGAWDNAKKFIERGLIENERKGGDAHAAAVIGDTVGDPFKDTTGPAMNILVKLLSIVSLVLVPFVV